MPLEIGADLSYIECQDGHRQGAPYLASLMETNVLLRFGEKSAIERVE